MAEKEVIKLKYPIPIQKEGGGEVMCSELVIGRIKAKHLKLLPDEMFDGGKVPPAKVIDVIAALAEISSESAGEIDMIDVATISERLGHFLGNTLDTSGES